MKFWKGLCWNCVNSLLHPLENIFYEQMRPLMNLLIGISAMKNCKLYLNSAGYCLAKGRHALKDGKLENIPFNALFGLIQHSDQGWILIK